MHDLIIEGGTVVDGTGAPAYTGDLIIDADRITTITRTRSTARARRRIKADGLTVTPGFIDPHTHYDAQFCWDGLLTSSPEQN